jgi:hypothetical protein
LKSADYSGRYENIVELDGQPVAMAFKSRIKFQF